MLTSLIAILSLLAWAYLALFRGRFWQPLLPPFASAPDNWPSVDIIVPARDEAASLPQSLPALLAQDYPGAWRIILVDDHSTDGTAAIVRNIMEQKNAENRLTIIDAPVLPPGWNGKLAALDAGLKQSKADYVLFTDADILHPARSLRDQVARAVKFKLDLTSLMAKLHCESFAEQWLIPPFVFFFAMLYPFRSTNDPASGIAGAAGGVMLVKRAALDNIGGLAAIKSELIVDCALARAIKRSGGSIHLALAYDIKSLRVYTSITDVWNLVARTAYTQLRHSPLLLGATLIGMGIVFIAPALLPVHGGHLATEAGLAAWLAMTLLYMPTVNFYRLSIVWAVMLPAAALVYIGATIDSARLYWQGRGGQWKGRTQV